MPSCRQLAEYDDQYKITTVTTAVNAYAIGLSVMGESKPRFDLNRD